MTIFDEVKICKVESCGLEVYAKGYCYDCYYRVRLKQMRLRRKTCKVETCNKHQYKKGYCKSCYKIWEQIKSSTRRVLALKQGKLTQNNIDSYIPNKCTVETCNKDHYSKGLCRSCYMKKRRQMLLLTDERENRKFNDLPAHLLEIHSFARQVQTPVNRIRADYFMHIQEHNGLEVIHVNHVQRYKQFIKELRLEAAQASNRVRIKTIRISDYLIALRGEEW